MYKVISCDCAPMSSPHLLFSSSLSVVFAGLGQLSPGEVDVDSDTEAEVLLEELKDIQDTPSKPVSSQQSGASANATNATNTAAKKPQSATSLASPTKTSQPQELSVTADLEAELEDLLKNAPVPEDTGSPKLSDKDLQLDDADSDIMKELQAELAASSKT